MDFSNLDWTFHVKLFLKEEIYGKSVLLSFWIRLQRLPHEILRVSGQLEVTKNAKFWCEHRHGFSFSFFKTQSRKIRTSVGLNFFTLTDVYILYTSILKEIWIFCILSHNRWDFQKKFFTSKLEDFRFHIFSKCVCVAPKAYGCIRLLTYSTIFMLCEHIKPRVDGRNFEICCKFLKQPFLQTTTTHRCWQQFWNFCHPHIMPRLSDSIFSRQINLAFKLSDHSEICNKFRNFHHNDTCLICFCFGGCYFASCEINCKDQFFLGVDISEIVRLSGCKIFEDCLRSCFE